jgi:hypothetical protein
MAKFKPYFLKGEKIELEHGMLKTLTLEVLVPMKCLTIYSNKKDAEHDAAGFDKRGWATKIVPDAEKGRGYQLWISVHKWGIQ